MHVHSLISKPISPQKLMQTLIPSSYFNMCDALEVSKSNILKAGESFEGEEKEMHAIDAKSFLCGQKSFFDLYVRLGPAKFLMILKAGDSFDPSRLLSYLNKGVASFYIKREAQLFYLQYCDKLTAALLASENAPLDLKACQVQNLGREAFDFLRTGGVSETSLNLAASFVKHTGKLFKSSGLDQISLLQSFLQNSSAVDHGTATVAIVSMLVKTMGFTDDKVTGLIGLGAFVHDIGMFSLPESIRVKEEKDEEMSEEERQAFETHPKIGADILLKVPHMNPLLPQIVLQHHERRTRRGFPSKLGGGAIAPAAEMVGLAEQLMEVFRLKDNEPHTPFEVIKRDYSDEFSLKIIDAFLKTFNVK